MSDLDCKALVGFRDTGDFIAVAVRSATIEVSERLILSDGRLLNVTGLPTDPESGFAIVGRAQMATVRAVVIGLSPAQAETLYNQAGVPLILWTGEAEPIAAAYRPLEARAVDLRIEDGLVTLCLEAEQEGPIKYEEATCAPL